MDDLIRFNQDSVLKPFPMDSSKIDPALCQNVKAGTTFSLADYGNAPEGHIFIELVNPVKGQSKWFVWSEHCTIEADEGAHGPEAEQEHEGPFRLPGYKSTFYLTKPILDGGSFTWAEATKGGQRIPDGKAVVEEILKIARVMQDIRDMFGDRPIIVTSWYRDPVTNLRVGGARQSRHLTGGAVDFKISGVSPSEVQQRLDPWWAGKGGLASARTFTHIDNRGYRARWRYGR
ncbi:MAG: D-Ala-D-Ala carboxypeptidase family metallohydrolase [Elainellaceae cyanobacterium]